MDVHNLEYYINQILELSPEELGLLTACVVSRQLKKGELILKEGAICRHFYLVQKGHLRTWYNKDGVSINLNFTFEGSFSSNLKSLKNREASTFNIEAGEDSDVWVFPLDNISRQLNLYPQISRFIRRLAIQILIDSEEYSNLFKIHTPAERYYYMEQNNPRLLQRIPLSQIASYLGVARETLSRIRARK